MVENSPGYALGIDPGKDGALVLVEYRTYRLVDFLLMPNNGKTKTELEILGEPVVNFLKPHLPLIRKAFVEDVTSYSDQGHVNAATFMRCTGEIIGICKGGGLKPIKIHPTTWKAFHKFSGQGKDGPRSRICKKYPEIKELQLKGTGQAIADAYFIALTGIKKPVKLRK